MLLYDQTTSEVSINVPMSKNIFTLSILGITDTNIKVTAVSDEKGSSRGVTRQAHVIYCEPSHPLSRCPNYQFATLQRYGYELTQVKVPRAAETLTIIALKKTALVVH